MNIIHVADRESVKGCTHHSFRMSGNDKEVAVLQF